MPICKPRMIEIDWYMSLYEMTDSEKVFVKTYKKKEYEIFGLRCCGADFILKKDNKYTLAEIKTTLNKSNMDKSILQLIYGKDMVLKCFSINIEKMIIWSMFEQTTGNGQRDIKARNRFLNHFSIEKEILYTGDLFEEYEKGKIKTIFDE